MVLPWSLSVVKKHCCQNVIYDLFAKIDRMELWHQYFDCWVIPDLLGSLFIAKEKNA